MNTMKRIIKSWFSQELTDCLLWNEYKEMIAEYIKKNNQHLRVPIYKLHLDFLSSPKWNSQYSHTTEFLFVREETARQKKGEIIQKLKIELLQKYEVARLQQVKNIPINEVITEEKKEAIELSTASSNTDKTDIAS